MTHLNILQYAGNFQFANIFPSLTIFFYSTSISISVLTKEGSQKYYNSEMSTNDIYRHMKDMRTLMR